MYGTRNRSPADTEVIEVLTAISQVSARLAKKNNATVKNPSGLRSAVRSPGLNCNDRYHSLPNLLGVRQRTDICQFDDTFHSDARVHRKRLSVKTRKVP